MNQNKNIEWVKKEEPTDVLYRLKRGLVGYVSYLAACEMNESFSEYILYEPILRILTARGFKVECECSIGVKENENQTGDKKRIDFSVTNLINPDLRFAIEVKWAKKMRLDIRNDHVKLHWFKQNVANSRAFLCVFGRESLINDIRLRSLQSRQQGTFIEKGKIRTADLGKTKYSCRVYELRYRKKPI